MVYCKCSAFIVSMPALLFGFSLDKTCHLGKFWRHMPRSDCEPRSRVRSLDKFDKKNWPEAKDFLHFPKYSYKVQDTVFFVQRVQRISLFMLLRCC